MNARLSPTQRRVLQAFRDHPGATTAQVAEHLGMSPNQVSPRVIELLRMGLLRKTGTTTGKKGRPAETYQAIEETPEDP